MAKANIFIIIKHFVHTGTYDLEREKSKEIWCPRNSLPFVYMPLLHFPSFPLIPHPFLKGITKKEFLNCRLISNHTSTPVN